MTTVAPLVPMQLLTAVCTSACDVEAAVHVSAIAGTAGVSKMASPMRKLNAMLLQKLAEFILANPDKLEWQCFRDGEMHIADRNGKGCIEYWALVLSGEPMPRAGEITARAARQLGLEYNNNAAFTEADRILHPPMWDEPFRTNFEAAANADERAKAFSANIESFLLVSNVHA